MLSGGISDDEQRRLHEENLYLRAENERLRTDNGHQRRIADRLRGRLDAGSHHTTLLDGRLRSIKTDPFYLAALAESPQAADAYPPLGPRVLVDDTPPTSPKKDGSENPLPSEASEQRQRQPLNAITHNCPSSSAHSLTSAVSSPGGRPFPRFSATATAAAPAPAPFHPLTELLTIVPEAPKLSYQPSSQMEPDTILSVKPESGGEPLTEHSVEPEAKCELDTEDESQEPDTENESQEPESQNITSYPPRPMSALSSGLLSPYRPIPLPRTTHRAGSLNNIHHGLLPIPSSAFVPATTFETTYPVAPDPHSRSSFDRLAARQLGFYDEEEEEEADEAEEEEKGI